MSKPSELTLLSLLIVFDLTLTNHFQYQNEFVDNDNLTASDQRNKLSKFPIS